MQTKKVNKRKKNSKSKSKPKRLGTFNSSEFSLLEERNYLSTCDIFRNDAIKKKNNTTFISAAKALPQKKMKSAKNLQTKKKGKSKAKIRRQQTYDIVHYKASLNSEIMFSNEDTKRQEKDGSHCENAIAISYDQKFAAGSNNMVRVNIKKEFIRRTDAAVKIQKVFRGYLTRKILQKYIHQEQKLLSERLGTHKSEDISQHSSYFAEKSSRQEKRKAISPREPTTLFEDKQPAIENAEEVQSEEEDENDQDNEVISYRPRHQQPIYSHEEISKYLQSSSEDEQNDIFQDHIIFETNQEYLDSRKSSLQNKHQPKNKLSRPTTQIDQVIPEEPSQRVQTEINQTHQEHSHEEKLSKRESDLTKTEKKDKEKYRFQENNNEIKEETIKITEESESGNLQFNQTIAYESTMKESKSKNMQDNIIKGSPSREKEEVEKLKTIQLQKWDEIINLLHSQMKKYEQNNLETQNFMTAILDMSIKNKLTLQSQQSDEQIFSTPLSENYEQNKAKSQRVRKFNRNYLQSLQMFNKEKEEIQNESGGEESASKTFNSEDKINLIFEDKIERPQKNNRKEKVCFFFDNEKEEQNEQCFQKSKMKQNSNELVNQFTPLSSFENTGNIKKFLLGNIQDDHVNEMLYMREELIKKKQSEELKRLNIKLSAGFVDQNSFLEELEEITSKYRNQKETIQKSRRDIITGYRAAFNLTKDAFADAKKLGYKLPISLSMDGLPCKNPLIFSQIIIDELANSKKNKGRIDKKNEQKKIVKMFDHSEKSNEEEFEEQIQISFESSENSEVDFTEEQINRFKKAQPYDLRGDEEIRNLGSNVVISEDFITRHQHGFDKDEGDEKANLMKTNIHVFKEVYQIEEISPSPFKARTNPNVEIITEKVIDQLIWQLASQFLVKPIFSERLIEKSHFYKPQAINNTERKRFIALLEQNLPNFQEINQKLNQKICPLPSELLKCMRIDFSEEEEEEESYEEIGKYEFIIDQEVCNKAIQIFKEEIENQDIYHFTGLTEFQELSQEFQFQQKVVKYIAQREKFLQNRMKHTKELRWEVLNIEVHCIFDAWNQWLINLRSQKSGFSGIGLNELTLSVKDHNSKVKIEDTLEVIEKGKKKLLHNLCLAEFEDKEFEEDDQFLESDSKWIFYADEALSYGLELVYLIEEEIFGEGVKEMRKKFLF